MNILITGAWKHAGKSIGQIEALGHETVFMQQEKDALPCEAEWVEGVICNGLFQYHPIEKFTALRYIQLTSAGFDRVPMKYVQEHGIEIHNAFGVYSVPMAEFALAGVLQLYKGMAFFRGNQKNHVWEKHRNLRELMGKTVVILGCGSVGTECARRFHAFGCKVIGIDAVALQKEGFDEIFDLSCLDAWLEKADVFILTLPLTDGTRGIIDGRRFELLKQDAVLVNIARGGLIDTKALEKGVSRIGGAVLDVFETEPLPPESPLWEYENVIITPHNSFVGENNEDRLEHVILQMLRNKG